VREGALSSRRSLGFDSLVNSSSMGTDLFVAEFIGCIQNHRSVRGPSPMYGCVRRKNKPVQSSLQYLHTVMRPNNSWVTVTSP
jgi:hypothetical protein